MLSLLINNATIKVNSFLDLYIKNIIFFIILTKKKYFLIFYIHKSNDLLVTIR